MAGAHDVVVVGGSLAGCATAALLARQGVSVALVERAPKLDHYKRACTHYIQPPAVEVLERLGLIEAIESAGAVRNGVDIWTRFGWIRPRGDDLPYGYDLRREKLDPMVRRAAIDAGVDYLPGHAATELLRGASRRPCGVVAGNARLRARVVVGADGRGSTTARLAGVPGRVRPHNRFGYFAYFTGVDMPTGGRSLAWFSDPDVGYFFPNDDGLVLVAALAHKDRLPEFKAGVDAAVHRFAAALPDAPSLEHAERVGPWIGRVDVPNVRRPAAVPGVAFVGDAAQASDPIWGVGCGFALTSGMWLADELAGALVADTDVDAALTRYARRHRRALAGHHFFMSDYATGRRFHVVEKLLYRGATRDGHVARALARLGTRAEPVRKTLTPALVARATVAAARRTTVPA